jgi:light-harvesting complex 1 beta chain
MQQSTTAREMSREVVENDLVPAQWKPLFNNEEWLIHDIVVKSMWGFGIIAFIAHMLILAWIPWIS